MLYLIFNEGYAAHSGDDLVRHDLCDEAIRLGHVLAELMPREPEIAGAARAHGAPRCPRASARTDADGNPILLDDQDRRRWDRARIARRPGGLARRRADGAGVVPPPGRDRRAARAGGVLGRDTDWPAIVALYDDLVALAPSPVVDLNLAVAVSTSEGPQEGLVVVDRLAAEPALSALPPAAGRSRRHAPPVWAGRPRRWPSTGARSSSRRGGGPAFLSGAAPSSGDDASSSHGAQDPFSRALPGARALYAMAYGEISSSLYYALGITASTRSP